jgi:hypothetical protein
MLLLTSSVQQGPEHWALTAELKEEVRSEAHMRAQRALVRNARPGLVLGSSSALA